MASHLERVRAWARSLKRDVVALWIAARDPRTPLAAKVVAAFVAAYALSPIDLIPDFVPVLGYLDDLLIVPLGVALVIRMIPQELMDEFRENAARKVDRPTSIFAAMFILIVWLVLLGVLGGWLWSRYAS